MRFTLARLLLLAITTPPLPSLVGLLQEASAMHTSSTTRCPGCAALRESLLWIADRLRDATIKARILGHIRTVLARAEELTARPPAWIWVPVHMIDFTACMSSWPINPMDRPYYRLAQCRCRGGRDIGWRKFEERIDVALDAAYRPLRCPGCGWESERCCCKEIERHMRALEEIRRGGR